MVNVSIRGLSVVDVTTIIAFLSERMKISSVSALQVGLVDARCGFVGVAASSILVCLVIASSVLAFEGLW